VSASVSTAGAAVSLCAAFFARLGLALATVRFAALATLRALPPRFCTFDAFLRLAVIAPLGAAQRYNGPSRSQLSNASYQQIARLSATTHALFFSGRTGLPFFEQKGQG
jgi:hypothetical protein